MKPVKSKLSYNEVLVKMAAYCAYQERSLIELQNKLTALGLDEQEQKEVIDFLAHENYWNEERFAFTFVKSKLHQHHWGKVKIKFELSKKVKDYTLIARALDTIDHDEYQEILEKVLLSKKSSYSSDNPATRQKLIRYALQKGFSYDEIIEKIDTLFK
ncbi:MAG: recombination regulator RecX [Flammeovirgaceae bacterium]|nr:recombination regulator RecX [Flammeovirgaceae bacterium]MDW8287521.1 regulatory protein RecX [Flammeovirgaceae bacterium]